MKLVCLVSTNPILMFWIIFWTEQKQHCCNNRCKYLLLFTNDHIKWCKRRFDSHWETIIWFCYLIHYFIIRPELFCMLGIVARGRSLGQTNLHANLHQLSTIDHQCHWCSQSGLGSKTMLYALVLIQVANLIVVTTIDPSNYNRSINQHRHSNQQSNQYRPNYPQSQRQILFGKNFSIEKQNISKLFSTISVPIYQLQPSSKQRHYVGHVYNITINRPTKAVDRSKSLLLRADNTGTGKAALKKGKYRPIPNQYYHHLIHHHYQPIVSGIDNLILSSISYRLPTIDTSPHYYYPIWRNQFELKQTNSATTTSSPLPATTSDLISLSSSSSSSSSLTSSASLMSSATQYYDPDDSEILIQRTAPDSMWFVVGFCSILNQNSFSSF